MFRYQKRFRGLILAILVAAIAISSIACGSSVDAANGYEDTPTWFLSHLPSILGSLVAAGAILAFGYRMMRRGEKTLESIKENSDQVKKLADKDAKQDESIQSLQESQRETRDALEEHFEVDEQNQVVLNEKLDELLADNKNKKRFGLF